MNQSHKLTITANHSGKDGRLASFGGRCGCGETFVNSASADTQRWQFTRHLLDVIEDMGRQVDQLEQVAKELSAELDETTDALTEAKRATPAKVATIPIVNLIGHVLRIRTVARQQVHGRRAVAADVTPLTGDHADKTFRIVLIQQGIVEELDRYPLGDVLVRRLCQRRGYDPRQHAARGYLYLTRA